MSFAEDYLFDEVTIAGRGTTNKYGKWNYDGTFRTVNARVNEKTGVIKLPSGKEHSYTLEVTLPASDPVGLEDRITYSGRDYIVMDVETVKMLDGSVSHKAARIG